MRAIIVDAIEIDGSGDAVEIDVAAAMPSGIRYYRMVLVDTGGVGVALAPPGSAQEDPSKAGEVLQVYPTTHGAYLVSDGNPHLISALGMATTVGVTVYALTDEQP